MEFEGPICSDLDHHNDSDLFGDGEKALCSNPSDANASSISMITNLSASDALKFLQESGSNSGSIKDYDTDEMEKYFLEEDSEKPASEKLSSSETSNSLPNDSSSETTPPVKQLFILENYSAKYTKIVGDAKEKEFPTTPFKMIIAAGYTVMDFANTAVKIGFDIGLASKHVPPAELDSFYPTSDAASSAQNYGSSSFDSQNTLSPPINVIPESMLGMDEAELLNVQAADVTKHLKDPLEIDSKQALSIENILDAEDAQDLDSKQALSIENILDAEEAQDIEITAEIKDTAATTKIQPSAQFDSQSNENKENLVSIVDYGSSCAIKNDQMEHFYIKQSVSDGASGVEIESLKLTDFKEESVPKEEDVEDNLPLDILELGNFVDCLVGDALEVVEEKATEEEDDEVFLAPVSKENKAEVGDDKFWDEYMVIKSSTYKEIRTWTEQLKKSVERKENTDELNKEQLLAKLESLLLSVDEPPNEASRTHCLQQKKAKCLYTKEEILQLRRAYQEKVGPDLISYDKETLMNLQKSALANRKLSLDMQKLKNVLK